MQNEVKVAFLSHVSPQVAYADVSLVFIDSSAYVHVHQEQYFLTRPTRIARNEKIASCSYYSVVKYILRRRHRRIGPRQFKLKVRSQRRYMKIGDHAASSLEGLKYVPRKSGKMQICLSCPERLQVTSPRQSLMPTGHLPPFDAPAFQKASAVTATPFPIKLIRRQCEVDESGPLLSLAQQRSLIHVHPRSAVWPTESFWPS